jgi:D-serine deaminase-like pyridoxal phosphate-dependent protein
MDAVVNADALAALGDLADEPAGFRFRSLPAAATVAAAVAGRPDLFGGAFLSPVAVLRESAVAHNIATMADYCATHGVLLAPHGKTSMAPQLFARQLAAGAWGMTAATVGHVRTYRAFGVRRVLLANELVDEGAISWLAGELAADPGFDFYCYVDSADGARLLEGELAAAGADRAVQVLVELGNPGDRTGARTLDAALAAAHAAAAAPHLAVAGVAGYEGGLGDGGSAAGLAAVDGLCARMRELATALVDRRLLDPAATELIVTAGGSAYFDQVVASLTAGPWPAQPQVRVVLRSGSYVTHDEGVYTRVGAFDRNPGGPWQLRPAFEVWGRVLSRPEPDLALLDVGRRDAPFDQDLPMPRWIRPRGSAMPRPTTAHVTALNDQHAFVAVDPDDPLTVGDWVGLAISHPCTAFDKWQLLLLVDDDYRVLGTVRTFF